ncbi:MAG: SpoIID/LytB domain-containing protein [Acutalibacteraceae bacterium]|nr:SpoIID/LytB domain-containing protein [Acutalibacteraceae bacterium]
MKKYIFTVLLLIIVIATAPLISVAMNSEKYNKEKNISEKTTETDKAVTAIAKSTTEASEENSKATEKINEATIKNVEPSTKSSSATSDCSFKIFDKSTNNVITVNDFDFCCGALATETEADIPFEALKAQAIAVHTYYSYLRNESRNSNKEYDFECNSKIWQVYVSESQLKEKLGDTFDDTYNTIKKAVNEVSDTFVLYENKLCMTKYFEISSGTTYSNKEIYNEDIPYLQSIPSPFDTLANNYKTEVIFSEDEFNKTLKEKYSNYTPKDSPDENISDIDITEHGAVLKLKVGNTEITGDDFVDMFNLRSRNFSISYTNEKYSITVLGYGENIGLSKFGACEMSKQGSDYFEILQHYYPNTEIVKGYAPL